MESILGSFLGFAIGIPIGLWLLKKVFKKDLSRGPAKTVVRCGDISFNTPFKVPDFDGRLFVVSDGFWGPRVFTGVGKYRNAYSNVTVPNNAGEVCEVKIHSSVPFLDPLHSISVGKYHFHIQRPLVWYQYVWCSWPILLMTIGGAIGGALGAAAVFLNVRFFRAQATPWVKYAGTLGISMLAVCIWWALWWWIHELAGDMPAVTGQGQ